MGLNTLTRLFKEYYKIYLLEEMLETTLTKNSETNSLFNMNYRLK